MSILGGIKQLFAGKSDKNRMGVRASFDAASRSPESRRNFAGANALSADAALSPDVRHLIAQRVRQEVENNGYLKGIIKTLAEDTVGTGAYLQIVPQRELDDISREMYLRREERWDAWTTRIGLTQKLKIARMAKARDGECFIRIGRNPAIGEIPLDIQVYEAEQVGSYQIRNGTYDRYENGSIKECDGILYDIYGNVSSYRLWRIHPGDGLYYGGSGASDMVKASSMLHYANIERPGQHRGLSELASCLTIFNDLRRYCEAVVSGAEQAANIAFVASTDLEPDDDDAKDGILSPGTKIVLPKAAGLALPNGWKATQFKPEQPTQTYNEFVNAKLCEAARPLSMPFNVAKGNSSGYNYASGRLDHQTYHKTLKGEQEYIRTVILEPLFILFERLDVLAHPGDYSAAPVTHTWVWDSFGHVDPSKEATALNLRLTAGVTTLKDECAREGKSWEEVVRQRAIEKRLLEELGLPFTAAAGEMQSADYGENDEQ